MRKTLKPALSVKEIADKATRGEDVSGYFSNKFTVVRPVRQADIKTLLSHALEKGRGGKTRPGRKSG